jgi:hypothetical protein
MLETSQQYIFLMKCQQYSKKSFECPASWTHILYKGNYCNYSNKFGVIATNGLQSKKEKLSLFELEYTVNFSLSTHYNLIQKFKLCLNYSSSGKANIGKTYKRKRILIVSYNKYY